MQGERTKVKSSKGVVLGFLLVCLAFIAIPSAAQAKPTITISGSTTVAPLATQLAKGYVKACNGCVKFKLLQGGSDIGVADVSRGRVTLGMSSRIPKPSDPGGIVFNEIAKDALCLASHTSNRIANMTQDQAQDVFSGAVRNWNLVPGSNKSGTINVVIRTAASGTQDAFDKIFMAPKKTFSGASQKASNGLIEQQLERDPLAIGYLSLAFQKGVHIINYKGVPCTLRAAKSGQYPGTRPLFLVSRGALSGASAKWVKWIRTNKRALAIAATSWVPFR
jgi:phosphate transport system substrate-binding protein